MGTKWDLDLWQGEKGKSSPTVRVSCTEGLMIEIQWAEGWLKTVLHISHSVFETQNLNCSYLQISTSLKPISTRVMVFLQWAQPWVQLPKYLSQRDVQNSMEALQFLQYSAEDIKLQGWFSMGSPYVQHQLQKFWMRFSPAYSHTHVVTFTVQGRITPGVTLSRSEGKLLPRCSSLRRESRVLETLCRRHFSSSVIPGCFRPKTCISKARPTARLEEHAEPIS